ncbi:MAG TPA: hypothetical protein VG710_12190 [Opitutus sp.]|nr:hypothetical protein [Opitutus sp.]
MKNIALLLALLLAPLGLVTFGISMPVCARLGLSLMFAFTGVGHFVKHREMQEMIPANFPLRSPVIYASGVLEWAFAGAIWIKPIAQPAGVVLCLFLVAVFPANIYSARSRIAFGGHAAGLRYLWVRAPLQLLLLGWTWFFVARK